MDTYILLNIEAFKDEPSKVLYIASYLEGDIYQWFVLRVQEWIDIGDAKQTPYSTKVMFNDYDAFK